MILATTISSCSQTEVSDKRDTDQLVPIDLSNVSIKGEIGRRIDITISNNLLLLDIENDFLASFREKNDNGYVGLGKLIDGAVKMAAYTKDEKVISIKNKLVDEIIQAQEDDGYIGNKSPGNRMWKLWDIHEMGYIINGLITNYRLFNDRQSLVAAEKAANYIIGRWSSKPSGWGNSTGVVEHVAITGIHRTMFALYNVTNNKLYLDFCLNQLDMINLDPGIVIGRRELIEGHIYGYMAASLAQLELYRIIPDEKLLAPTMKALNFMTSNDGMSISGGSGQSEIWTDDQDGRGDLGESCATAYQLRVYDNLLRLKSDSRFGDIMERTIYNALFGAQSPDGRQIRYFTPLEGTRVYHDGDTYCCPCNYRRFISELPSMVYYRSENGVAINLYTTSTANIPLDEGGKVVVEQKTNYPSSGQVVITINPFESASFPLKLRIPSWCKDASIYINGNQSDVICKSGTFAVIKRQWESGDQVMLEMPMEWRLVLGREKQAGRVALMRGPLLFCLDPDQNESLSETDGADLGRIVIDLASIEPIPLINDAVRPDGIACRLKAGNIPMALGNRKNLTLTFTEFADPNGKCTYFRVPDLSEAVPDELLDLW